MNDQVETPASNKKISALAVFLEANKAKKINETDKKAVGAKFKKAMGEREKIVAQLEAFDKTAQKLAEEMIGCFGGAKIVVDGVQYVPTCRGPRIFYKRMSELDSVEL